MQENVTLLALDLGSTHFKAALFDERLRMLRSAAADVRLDQQAGGPVIGAAWTATTLFDLIRQVLSGSDSHRLVGIGIASMAETGLLVENATGQPVTPLLPWFHRAAETQLELIAAVDPGQESFRWSGIYPSFKAPLARLLWLRDSQGVPLLGRTWLSAADYAAFLLTGRYATDYSLAGRTLAFHISEKKWHAPWLGAFGLPVDLFPPAFLAGYPMGQVTGQTADVCGLPTGIPVTIAGHDHICAALAAGVTSPGPLLDSMGTAEALVGAMPERLLNEDDQRNGLLFGCHVIPEQMYWLGGLSSSGGALEWLRSALNTPHLTYAEMQSWLPETPTGPGEIIFLPYLSGSGAPHSDPHTRAAWIGLHAGHTHADLYRAVLEGTAYEIEFIRRAAGAVPGIRAEHLVAIGGGTRNRRWLEIKANVSGQAITLPAVSEATLAGAAALASAAGGLYASAVDAVQAADWPPSETIRPNPVSHRGYADMFEHGYLALQDSVRQFSRYLAGPPPGAGTAQG